MHRISPTKAGWLGADRLKPVENRLRVRRAAPFRGPKQPDASASGLESPHRPALKHGAEADRLKGVSCAAGLAVGPLQGARIAGCFSVRRPIRPIPPASPTRINRGGASRVTGRAAPEAYCGRCYCACGVSVSSGFSSSARFITRRSLSTSTVMMLAIGNSPDRIPSDRRSSISFWIRRRSGRAPYSTS